MVEMSLEMLQSEAVADIPTVDPNNDFYVMEPEKELLDCINTVDESQLEKLDNTILAINVPTSMDAEEDNNNIWKVVNVSQAQNMQDIEEEVTNNIMVNEEKGNGKIGVDVQSESTSNWESEDQSDLEGDNETEHESSDNSESEGAVDRIDNSNAAGSANNKGDVFHPVSRECVDSKASFFCRENSDYHSTQPNNYLDDIETTVMQNSNNLLTSTLETTEGNTFNMYNFENSALNMLEQDRVPLSIVDNISMDRIGNQMSLLIKLIDNLKNNMNSEESLVNNNNFEVKPMKYVAFSQNSISNPVSSENGVVSYSLSNSLKIEPDMIQAQLSEVNKKKEIQKEEETKLNLDKLHVLAETKINTLPAMQSDPYYTTDPQDVVTFLFRKYLTNNSFMNKGEYVKKDSADSHMMTIKKPEFSTEQSYNFVNKVSREDYITSKKNHTSPITDSKTTHGFHGNSCRSGLRLPNPNDCARYFLCSSSTISLRNYTCPPNTAFNIVKRICDAAEYYKCVNKIKQRLHNEVTVNYNSVPCDTYMCGGLQSYNKFNQSFIEIKCERNSEYCVKKQKCLPLDLC
ncbi:hypothetical protein FQA39_LY12274 [Lamprigera yunnana]|nr:hypothetical protein FQA39_LY12274 [Lamprigera yunnana]